MRNIPAQVEFLRQRRVDLGLSQREVARQAGLAVSAVHEYENGSHEPTLFSLVAWADALGCDVAVAARAAVAS